jgi:TnpA family transposase
LHRRELVSWFPVPDLWSSVLSNTWLSAMTPRGRIQQSTVMRFLILRNLESYPRQNSLALALRNRRTGSRPESETSVDGAMPVIAGIASP